jgi:hypothetical protein
MEGDKDGRGVKLSMRSAPPQLVAREVRCRDRPHQAPRATSDEMSLTFTFTTYHIKVLCKQDFAIQAHTATVS